MKALIRKKVSYGIAGPQDANDLSRLYGFSINGSKGETSARGCVTSEFEYINSSENHGNAIIATINGKIAGAAILTCFPDKKEIFPEWWIFGVKVDIYYRGAGIGEGLMVKSEQLALERGGKRLNLIASANNPAAVGLYKKVGYESVSMPKLDSYLANLEKVDGCPRIILSKIIQHVSSNVI